MKRGSYIIIFFIAWIFLVIVIGLLEEHSLLPKIRPKTENIHKSLIGIRDVKNNRQRRRWKFDDVSPVDFENFDNYSGNPDGCYIVPNIVHFIKFSSGEITFSEMVCYLAAVKNQKPDHLLIHYDVSSVKFSGKYWDILMNDTDFSAAVRLMPTEKPKKIFGQALNEKWKDEQASDYLRLEILMATGGIFIDNGIYLLRPLDNYRRYEFVIGFDDSHINNRVIVAHRDARLLPLWIDTYSESFRADDRLYNKVLLPSELALKHAHMIHLTKNGLKVPKVDFIYNPNVCWKRWCEWPYILFIQYSDYISWNWKNIHYNASKTILSFPKYRDWNEKNILLFHNAFRDMVLHVYNPYNFSLMYHCHNNYY